MTKPTNRRKRLPRQRQEMAGLADVAALAGVSTATVSRVLNGTAAVTKDVIARVEKACSELRYVPNGAARALSSRKSRTIGAVVPSIENSGFAVAVAALQKRLHASGYSLIVATSDYDADAELREVSLLMSRGIDGLLLVGDEHHPELIQTIEKQGLPFIETWTLSQNHACVGIDNAAATEAMTNHLMDLGHVRIGVISGRLQNNDRASARVRGIRRALEARGLSLAAEWTIERPYLISEGQLAMRSILSSAVRPTAVMCGNDQLAFGALIEAKSSGLVVPKDISITGFNDLDFARFLDPPLTTIHVPTSDIGRIAGDYLLGKVNNEPVLRVNELEPRLIVRSSAGPPPRS